MVSFDQFNIIYFAQRQHWKIELYNFWEERLEPDTVLVYSHSAIRGI